jgi:hypothetical protein
MGNRHRRHHKKSHKPKPQVLWSSNDAPGEPPTDRQREDAQARLVKDRRFLRKGPCAECPFRKDCEPKTGNDDPLVYAGQAAGPFWLPCHMDPEYGSDRLGMETLMQCGGAATFRANVGKTDLRDDLFLRLPPDHGKEVFASYAELVAHHGEISLEEAEEVLAKYPPELLAHAQLLASQGRGRVKLVPKRE